jgi:prepilin-type N-terminal cleavage/methylation domain-containing protein
MKIQDPTSNLQRSSKRQSSDSAGLVLEHSQDVGAWDLNFPLQRFNASTLQRAFTLIEMLMVISIIGIIAGLSIPVIKNFGKADVTVSASRQLLDGVGRARQLAMSQRTTVYMVFVPTNFWVTPDGTPPNSGWGKAVVQAGQLPALTNLFDKQLTGYNYLAYGALGDQPGQHTWHYLDSWQSLPDGTYIPMWKFYSPGLVGANTFSFSDPANANYVFHINQFSYTNTFPFPSTNVEAYMAGASWPSLPFIAFNYLGQLSDFSGNMLSGAGRTLSITGFPMGPGYDQDFAGGGVDIPLAQGSMVYGHDANRALMMGQPGIVEMPPGNSTNIAYNVIHIDPLTGRATLEYHKMQ